MANTVISQLEFNDISELVLSEDDEECIDEAMYISKALAQNYSVNVIRLNEYLACLRNDDRTEFIEAIGSALSIQEVHIDGGLIQVDDLVALLFCAKTLKVLKLKNVVLQVIQEHFQELERSLYHKDLKDFALENVTPAVEGIDTSNLVHLVSEKKGGGPVPIVVQVETRARGA